MCKHGFQQHQRWCFLLNFVRSLWSSIGMSLVWQILEVGPKHFPNPELGTGTWWWWSWWWWRWWWWWWWWWRRWWWWWQILEVGSGSKKILEPATGTARQTFSCETSAKYVSPVSGDASQPGWNLDVKKNQKFRPVCSDSLIATQMLTKSRNQYWLLLFKGKGKTNVDFLRNKWMTIRPGEKWKLQIESKCSEG